MPGFLGNIHQLRHAGLHLEGHFILCDARRDLDHLRLAREVLQQHCELVAAESDDRLIRTNLAHQEPGHPQQHLVARLDAGEPQPVTLAQLAARVREKQAGNAATPVVISAIIGGAFPSWLMVVVIVAIPVSILFRPRKDFRGTEFVDASGAIQQQALFHAQRFDRRRVLLDRQRYRIAPLDQQAATARLEQRAGIADVHVQFLRRTVLAGLLVELEGLFPCLIVDQRLHRRVVEVEALLGALRDRLPSPAVHGAMDSAPTPAIVSSAVSTRR